MSFVAINAKADIAQADVQAGVPSSTQKKGKITPEQFAQFASWCLADKTGILYCLNKCEVENTSLTPVNNQATATFKSGYVSICGRLIECEAGTTVTISTPTTGTKTGYIVVKYDLSGTKEDEVSIVVKDNLTLTQNDLNENSSSHNPPTTGIYEFPLYKYTATSSTVTLERTNDTTFIKSVGAELNLSENRLNDILGSGMSGSGSAPLQGYNKSNGTVETRFTNVGTSISGIEGNIGTINSRLNNLGFSTGNATNLTNVSSVTLKKLGKFVIARFTYTRSNFNFNLPSGFAPYSDFTVDGIGSGGKITINVSKTNNGVYCTRTGQEMSCTVQIGWSTDSNYPI